ncbi:DUF4136 domain-containing protein [Ichthyenterobacterium magnum]|uniref:Uncharacterized protein DUF4136 n=1 Tax=Ichthyenterobacterium magnum TaxID=1230530 RepID=A0A420DFR3_9FLAO|nr:DUF4136 domain-containing protein [Ichthyenterobacterium magnum]RKE90977.1 uncharacterized protein DUF4136 [Ichthyenterobacterium magnum]
MKILKITIIALLLMSCGATVNYDYEKGTDFTQYKTYNYYTDMNTGMSELDTKRLFNVLNANLKQKGFSLSETPDFLIDIKSSEFQNNQRNTVGVGLGGGGRTIGGGISVGIPIGQSKHSRQIIIDFVDENKNSLFWQAVSENSYNPNATPEKREAVFMALVEKVLSKYPPK